MTSRRLSIGILAGLSAFPPLSIDIYLPGVPGVTSDLDASATGIQLTLTACVIGLAVGQLVIGPLSDMVGRRRPLLIGLVVFVGASLVCAAAGSLPLLIAGRLAQGLSGAAGVVIARAMVRDVYSGVEAGRAYSTLGAIMGSAPIFAPLLGAGVLLFTGWRGLFVALAAIGVVLLAATLLCTSETLPPARRSTNALGQTIREVALLCRQRSYMRFALAGGFGFAAFFAVVAASSFVYQDVYGFSPQLYSVLFALNGAVLMGSNLVNRRLLRRHEPSRLLWAGLAGVGTAGAAILLAVLAGAGAPAVLPLVILASCPSGLVVANSITLAMEGEADRAGAASALYGLIQFSLGALVAPLVAVGGASALPMAIVMAASAALAIAAYGILGFFRPGLDPAGSAR